MEKIALVYLVAGVSSRFGGKVKAFARIRKNEALIEYSLAQALKSGFSKIVFIVGSKTEKLFKKKFGNFYKKIPVFYALQEYDEKKRDKPWGTADALCSAKSFLECPFVVCNGDDIYGENTFKILFEHLNKSDEEAAVGYRLESVLPENEKVNRGIFQVEGEYVKSIKESFNIIKSDLSASGRKRDDLCSMNIFALHPDKLKLMSSSVEKFKKQHKADRKTELLLPVELSKLIENREIKMKVYPAIDRWFGITYREDVEKVREILEKER